MQAYGRRRSGDTIECFRERLGELVALAASLRAAGEVGVLCGLPVEALDNTLSNARLQHEVC